MEGDYPHGSNKHVVLMAFGLPLMTTVIVMGSMYAGHVLTTRSDRPTNVQVTSAAPKVDVNLPQMVPPSVQVTTPTPKVDVHVPQGPAPTVTVTTPPLAPPNITIAPATPTVTVIDRRDDKPLPPAISKEASLKDTKKETETKEPEKPAAPTEIKAPPPAASADASKPAISPTPIQAKPEPLRLPLSKPQSELDFEKRPPATVNAPVSGSTSHIILTQAKPGLGFREEDLSLETLYNYASQYIAAYCRKNGLDPDTEDKKWLKQWRAGLEQAMNDNIDSSEQSYINRMVILKRDYFDMSNAKPEKVVEACRILLRYRDGQLVWLKAMKDALTKENLKKTVTFLAAGP